MSDAPFQIRCQRCGEPMELMDPAPGQPWQPQQFWSCSRCGRHFWTTYAAAPGAPKPAPPAPPPAAKPAAAAPPPAPADQADPSQTPSGAA